MLKLSVENYAAYRIGGTGYEADYVGKHRDHGLSECVRGASDSAGRYGDGSGDPAPGI